MSLKAGVIGVGYLGRHHARVYSELEDVELSAVSDIEAERAGELSKKYGCRVVTDYRDMLPHVQALSIVTPTPTHYAIALECLRAGKDILLEKPMTVTLSEADRLIEEAGKRGCILQVGHLERFNPAVSALSGLLDRPEFFESERLSPFLERASDVDVTLDLMIHDIDIIMNLSGGAEPKDIKAAGSKVVTDKFDVVKAWLEFEGASALISASRIAGEKQRRLRIFQKNSFIELDYQRMQLRRYFKNGRGLSSELIKPEEKEPLKEQLKDFVECVLKRLRPKVSGIEGRNALKVALDIIERIENRQL